MLYGDSKNDKVDQQIDFMLRQSDDEIDDNQRIISIDNYKYYSTVNNSHTRQS